MVERKKTRLSAGFFVVFLLFCIGLAGLAWVIDQIPDFVEQDFGRPGAQLNRIDRILYSARLLIARDSLLSPVNPQGEPQRFNVELGESANSIFYRLELAGLIHNAENFRTFMIYAGLDTGIQAGAYQLNPAWNSVEIGRRLQDSTPSEITFVILAGWRAEEIAAALPSSGLTITPNELLIAIRNPLPTWLPSGFGITGSLEGYLFPGEYRFKRDARVGDLISAFVKRFDEQVTTEIRQGFEQQGISLPEAVILASIVQREGVVIEERPMIASVFLNRLAIGMKLDADPTVQYAVGYNDNQKTWWTNPLSRADLAFDSRYNTYLYTGLPPGSICNPSLSALRAVAYPAQSPYYYFRARCDNTGLHLFAVTFEEHLRNACP
jgi:UPF0755 protein